MNKRPGVLSLVKLKYDENDRRDLLDEIYQLRSIAKQQEVYIKKLKSTFREVIIYINSPSIMEVKKILTEDYIKL